MINIVKNVLIFIPDKLVAIDVNVTKIINFFDTRDWVFTYITKFSGTTIAAAKAVKGSIDFVKAVACQDRICAMFSAIDIAADELQICTPLIPGPNLTFVVSLPIYIILLVAR